jgi:hypothetical protein
VWVIAITRTNHRRSTWNHTQIWEILPDFLLTRTATGVMLVVVLGDMSTSCVLVDGSTLPIRPARYFDLRCLFLAAVFKGADYGHLALTWLRDECGVVVPLRTGYRVLQDLERSGHIESLLDGDVLGASDEWVRRVFRLTPDGRAHLRDLLSLYSHWRSDDV